MTYLLIALVVSVAGSVLMFYRHRGPRSDYAIEEFQQEMRALAPERKPPGRDRSP